MNIGRLGGLGDIVMCTAVLRAYKALYSGQSVAFYGNYLDVLRGLPYIDLVKDFADRPEDAILLSYEGKIRPGLHIIRHMGTLVGLDISDVRPDCVIDKSLVDYYRLMLIKYPRPWVVINRRASPWTPNKDWPDQLWSALITRLTKSSTIIEIGTRSDNSSLPTEENYINLVQKTNLKQLVAIIASCDIAITPVSGPMHIAAATRTPSVVIAGGYEPASATAYDGNEVLTSTPECSPCWKQEPCPYDKKCLSDISIISVESALTKIWNRISLQSFQ